MANVHRIYRVCDQCTGVGHLVKVGGGENGEVTTEEACPTCAGAKYYLWGWTTEATFDSDTELAGLG